MNPREISARFLLQSRCLLGLSVLLFLVSTPPQLGKAWKAIASGAAGVALGAAWVQRRQYEQYEPMGGVYSRHELQAYAQFLQTTTELGTAAVSGMWPTMDARARAIAPAETQLLLPAQTFDWQRFNSEPDQFAHLAIVGPTGSGKSTLAEALATQLGGVTMAIAPHRKPGDFKALGNRVYCGGRDYGTAKDKPADFPCLLNGSAGRVSVVSFIGALSEEMDRRYQLWEQGEDVGPFVNVIWDEILAAIAATPRSLVDQFLTLLREARKVKIRLIVLPQNDQVRSLKIDGQGADRENLTYIRLGKTAIAHAKSIGAETLAQVMAQRRPCIVEEIPAVVPEYNPAMVVITQDADLNVEQQDIQSPEIEKNLTKIKEYGEGKSVVTGSDIKRDINCLKGTSVPEINVLLERLVAHGVGDLDDSGKALKWLPPPTGTNGTNTQ